MYRFEQWAHLPVFFVRGKIRQQQLAARVRAPKSTNNNDTAQMGIKLSEGVARKQ
jgi:hypothetical protein